MNNQRHFSTKAALKSQISVYNDLYPTGFRRSDTAWCEWNYAVCQPVSGLVGVNCFHTTWWLSHSSDPALDCITLLELGAEVALAAVKPAQAPAAQSCQALRGSTAWMKGSTDTGSQQARTRAAALQSDWSHIIIFLWLFYKINVSRLSHNQCALQATSLSWTGMWVRGYNAPQNDHTQESCFKGVSL